MHRIAGSVGQGGRNTHDDVLLVQKMLNKNRHIVTTVGRVPEDGNLDDRTQRAIVAFQRAIVRLSSPDGRVDPNGRTWRILLGDSPHAATVAFVQLPAEGENYYLYENPDRVWGTPRTIESRPAARRRFSVSSVLRLETFSMCFTSAGERPWIQIGYVFLIQVKSPS